MSIFEILAGCGILIIAGASLAYFFFNKEEKEGTVRDDELSEFPVQERLQQIKLAAEFTQLPLHIVYRALVETEFDYEEAVALLSQSKIKTARPRPYASIFAFNLDPSCGVAIELRYKNTKTVESSDLAEFAELAAMQVTLTDPQSVKDLLEEEDITQPGIQIQDSLDELNLVTDDDVEIHSFVRILEGN